MLSFTLTATAIVATIWNGQAHRLEWDDNEHSSFSFIVQHNASQTMVISQILHDSITYELVDPIVVNSTGGLSATIRAYMAFEDPVDDIKQATDDYTDYRAHQYDSQSISSAKAAALLESVHNGSLEYVRSVNYEHLWNNDSLHEVKMKNYPINATCPESCKNIDEVGAFGATYGNPADSGCTSSQEDCIIYNCIYQEQPWGAGTCAPLVLDDSIEQIESEFEAWWAIIQEDDASLKYKIVWGYDDPGTGGSYPKRWTQQLLDNNANEDITKTCNSATVYWDNGFFPMYQSFYTPIAAVGNDYRKVSYSLENISISSEPTAIPITIGSYSGTEAAHITFPDVIKTAIADKLEYQRILMDDIGLHYIKNGQSLSNSSEWLFINDSYFGYGCDQLMVSQETWEDATCGDCMDNALSTWDLDEDGITTIPYYDYLDFSNGIEEAVRVTTNRSIYSEESIAIDFEYTWDHCNLTIESSDFAFKLPDVCNAVAMVGSDDSVHSTNVSFENCGDVSYAFKYTTNCANGYSTSTLSVTVAIDAVHSNWASAVTNLQCDAVSSITIDTASCPEFWDISCSWPVTLEILTDAPSNMPTYFPSLNPTAIPTNVPTEDPTGGPTQQPSGSPSDEPTTQPSNLPTASPIEIETSCLQYQVVPVRSAIGNTINHQDLCVAAKKDGYIVDVNTQKPYYVVSEADSVTATTLNKVNESDFDSGRDSNVPATGSALIGNSIMYIEKWLDVMAYLGLDVTTFSTSQNILTSIKMDGLDINTDLASISQSTFKSTLKDQIVSELYVDSDQIVVISLRSGSIIAEIELSSTESNTKSAAEIDNDLQNYIASKDASEASITSPLNSVNSYFYANESNDIMFTNCPFQIITTTMEDESVVVEWDTPTITSRVQGDTVTVEKAIGPDSGDSFSAGSYFIRYVAVSTNTSITPNYCSFSVVVEEEEWFIEFMGFEFGMTTLVIMASVMFCLCGGSVLYSCIMRAKGRGCCGCKKQGKVAPQKQDKIDSETDENNFKSSIIPPAHDVTVYDQDEEDSPRNNINIAKVSVVEESDAEEDGVDEDERVEENVQVVESANDESAVEESGTEVQVEQDSCNEEQNGDDKGVTVDTEDE